MSHEESFGDLDRNWYASEILRALTGYFDGVNIDRLGSYLVVGLTLPLKRADRYFAPNGVDAMPEESPNTFDEIKPFIRMLERSIDAARARRLAQQEGRGSVDNASGRSGEHAAPPTGSAPSGSVASESGDDPAEPSGRRQMATRSRFGQAEAKGSSATHRVDQRGGTLATPIYRH